MGSPAGVGDGNLAKEHCGFIDAGLCDEFAQTSDLSNLLEQQNFAWLVTVDANAGRVVATVLEALEPIAQYFADGLAVFLGEE